MPVQGCDDFEFRSSAFRPHDASEVSERSGDSTMKSRYRTRIAVLAVGLAAVVAATATAAFAASAKSTRSTADRKCPIATGSGDAAFVRNFNPFNVGTSRDFTWGGIYENLIVTTAFGGGNQYNILAKSVAFTKDGKTLNISIVPNAKWSNGKPVTAEDVALQPHDRPAGQGGRPHRPDRRLRRTSPASRSPARTASRSSSRTSTRRSSAPSSRTCRSSRRRSGRR